MKAFDLRVGNFVKHKRGEEIFEAVAESWLVPELRELIEQTYEPITITDEWLLKLGFKAIVGAKLWFTIPMTRGIQLEYDNGTFYIAGEIEAQTTMVAGLEYVHDLQNFYFANTGKELKLID